MIQGVFISMEEFDSIHKLVKEISRQLLDIIHTDNNVSNYADIVENNTHMIFDKVFKLEGLINNKNL